MPYTGNPGEYRMKKALAEQDLESAKSKQELVEAQWEFE